MIRWKFPGGLSNFKEDIPDTAMREVEEETGIKTGELLQWAQNSHKKEVSDSLQVISSRVALSQKQTGCREY